MSKKYFARLSESTAKKRKTFWKKLGTYPFTKDEYDRAKEVPGDSMETKPSKYNKKYKMMFGEEKKRSITALKKKSKASGIPYSILKRVYNRGMAAWVTGHRPGAKQSAWAFARVNSFLTKGKTWYGPDADLAKKARKYLNEQDFLVQKSSNRFNEIVNESICAKHRHMFNQYFSWGWIDPAGEIICPTESDKTHTSILRRLADEYDLPEDASEYHATKFGWIRWVVEYDIKTKNFVLFFNTVKFKKTPKTYSSILRIINDNADAKFYNFVYGSKWIQALTKQKFIDELSIFFRITHNQSNRFNETFDDFSLNLSGERRKRLMEEDQDYEIEMISGQLKKIIDLSTDTLNIIQNQTEIPAWIQDKISVSTHNAEAIFDYYNYSEEKIQEETQMKKVVIFPGGFHPFHKGHYSVYTAIKTKFPDADVYVASTNTQTERPFSFEDKEYLASQLGVPKESFVQVKIPYVAKEITSKYDPKNTAVIFALSEKDADRISYTKKDGTPGYFAKWTGENVEPLESKGYIFITPKIDFKIAGKQVDSASTIRKMYKEADNSEKNQIIKDMYPGGDVKNIKKILDNNLSEEITEDKFTYLKSGYIDPKGKELIGNHNDIAIKNGFMNRKQPILKNWIRFFITTDGEAAYEFNDIKKSLGYIKKHIEDNLYLINKLYLDGKISSRFSEEKLQKWFDYKKRKTQESVEIISETIRCSKKTGKKICFVFSEKGKKMGGPYSETKAKKRLRQIEFFKHLNK